MKVDIHDIIKIAPPGLHWHCTCSRHDPHPVAPRVPPGNLACPAASR